MFEVRWWIVGYYSHVLLYQWFNMGVSLFDTSYRFTIVI